MNFTILSKKYSLPWFISTSSHSSRVVRLNEDVKNEIWCGSESNSIQFFQPPKKTFSWASIDFLQFHTTFLNSFQNFRIASFFSEIYPPQWRRVSKRHHVDDDITFPSSNPWGGLSNLHHANDEENRTSSKSVIASLSLLAVTAEPSRLLFHPRGYLQAPPQPPHLLHSDTTLSCTLHLHLHIQYDLSSLTNHRLQHNTQYRSIQLIESELEVLIVGQLNLTQLSVSSSGIKTPLQVAGDKEAEWSGQVIRGNTGPWPLVATCTCSHGWQVIAELDVDVRGELTPETYGMVVIHERRLTCRTDTQGYTNIQQPKSSKVIINMCTSKVLCLRTSWNEE